MKRFSGLSPVSDAGFIRSQQLGSTQIPQINIWTEAPSSSQHQQAGTRMQTHKLDRLSPVCQIRISLQV